MFGSPTLQLTAIRRGFRALLLCASAVALLASAPGAPQALRELVAVFTQDDCCNHACDSEGCCPGQCLDCRYCAPAHALTPAVVAVALAPAVRLQRMAASADLHPSAYVSPPARPPAA